MKKIAFVVQRYGLEVNGGAEMECRMYAERLTDRYEVHVLTSRAIDYITWKDEYAAGEEMLNGVHVHRFSVAHPRVPADFDAINGRFLQGFLEPDEEEQWVEEQGPYLPELIDYLKAHEAEYEAFLFCTYLYYPTCMGVKAVAKKAITIPTAHDEPFLRMRIFDDVFQKPKAIFYNTAEEEKFVESKYHNAAIRSEIGGAGVVLPENVSPDAFREKYGFTNYLLYVGRIDEGKACDVLFRYFQEYKKRNPGDLKLVLMGKSVIPIPEDEDIVSLGFVSEEDKYNGMAAAQMLVLPSRFESLSIVVLESLALSVPVVVNGVCEVLHGHCTKSNAGLYYKNYFEFEAAINYLLEHKDVHDAMGVNGVRYVEENYCWDVIINRLDQLIRYVAEATAESEAAQKEEKSE